MREWGVWCVRMRFGVDIVALASDLVHLPEGSVNRCIKSVQAHRCGVAEDTLKMLIKPDEKYSLQDTASGLESCLAAWGPEDQQDADAEPEQPGRDSHRESRESLDSDALMLAMGTDFAHRNLKRKWNLAEHGSFAVQSILVRRWYTRVAMLFPVFHPWTVLVRMSLLTPRKVRVSLIFLKFVTAAATNALFFASNSPLPDSDPRCFEPENLFAALVQTAVVGISSALLGDFMVFILFRIQALRPVRKIAWTSSLRARQRMKWRFRLWLFWFLWLPYTIFCILYVALFLANVRLVDAHDWFACTGVSLLQDIVLLPAGCALVLGTLASLALASTRIRKKVETRWVQKDQQHTASIEAAPAAEEAQRPSDGVDDEVEGLFQSPGVPSEGERGPPRRGPIQPARLLATSGEADVQCQSDAMDEVEELFRTPQGPSEGVRPPPRLGPVQPARLPATSGEVRIPTGRAQ
ncbi:HERC2, partial [Symbiodinium pilosum]